MATVACLLLAAASPGPGRGRAYYVLPLNHPARTSYTSSTSLFAARLPPGDPGDPGPTGGMRRRKSWKSGNPNAPAKPAWQENLEYWEKREEIEKLNKEAGLNKKGPTMGQTVGSIYNDGGNTFAHMYTKKSTDQFKRPYEYQDEDEAHVVTNDFNVPPSSPRRADSQTLPPAQEAVNLPPAKKEGWVPDWFGSSKRTGDEAYNRLPADKPRGNQMFNANANRHAFQSSSTDDFKKPYMNDDEKRYLKQQQEYRPPPQQKKEVKAPFQTSSTDDFRRSSDVGSGVGAPQQPLYQSSAKGGGSGRADNPAWRNSMGQDVYGSTQLPSNQQAARQAEDAIVVNARQPMVSQSAAQYDGNQQQAVERTTTRRSRLGSGMMLRPIQWPVMRDPPGEAVDHPVLAYRALAVVLATLSTWHLHLHLGYSPVLASSALTMLISTCVDRRLGQAALCGSLAGMSGGALVPNPSMAAALGAVTWACYEVLIRINDLSRGIGGRVGATAFLATGILAKYRGIGSAGRKMRRGLWGASGPSVIAVSMILYHILGAVATILIREASVDDSDSAAADPVRATAVVGLLGSLFCQNPLAVLAVYGGSLVGASQPSRLMDGNAPARPKSATSLVASFAGAGALAGLIHAITIHSGHWKGWGGGKVALCAFAGCWIHRGLGNVVQFVQRRA
ncbi:hypothetical protein ACHAXT_003367 [Thalassiosira profunda]